MSGPDTIVRQHGMEVEHEWVLDYQTDANGQVEDGSVEWASERIKAVVSDPSDRDEQRADGRLSGDSRKLTVESDVDVRANRGGRRDRITLPPKGMDQLTTQGDDRLFEVAEVQDDEHPMTGTRKKTVLIDRLEGHQ